MGTCTFVLLLIYSISIKLIDLQRSIGKCISIGLTRYACDSSTDPSACVWNWCWVIFWRLVGRVKINVGLFRVYATTKIEKIYINFKTAHTRSVCQSNATTCYVVLCVRTYEFLALKFTLFSIYCTCCCTVKHLHGSVPFY